MKHIKHWLAIMAMLLCCITASAHNFEIGGIYYNIISDAEAEVTESGGEKYSGDITIPATITYNGVQYSVTSIGSYAFSGCSSLTSITIPKSVTLIGSDAFYGCSSLTSINIPESMDTIGWYAFSYCESLTAVHISSIGAWCKLSFGSNSNPIYYAQNLYLNGELVTELVIPEGVTSIRRGAFEGCSSLKTITIPKSVTSIESYAFFSCSSLTSISIPESVTSIGNGTFSDCESLTSINIPESVTSIGDEAFYNCNSLTKVNIPNKVSEIKWGTFRGCKNLKELTLGKGLKKIGCGRADNSGALEECKRLEKITIYATQPPRIDGDGNSIFSDATYENAMLYVPQGSVLKYQVMTGWNGFNNISEIEDSTPNYLTIRQADNGSVGIAVDLGRTYKVCITPSEGWAVHSVTFDGEDITAQLGEDNTLTTPTINGSAELNVAYEQLGGNEVKSTRANAIKVSGYEGIITVDGCADGELITIYTTDGAIAAQQKAEGESTRISVATGQLYIIKVADKVVKILM